jgi:hypothetical protein
MNGADWFWRRLVFAVAEKRKKEKNKEERKKLTQRRGGR